MWHLQRARRDLRVRVRGHPCRRLRLQRQSTGRPGTVADEADDDGDGVCDDVDSCVGEFDACGICNGPGAIYECGCEDIPAGDCDCNGNQLDALALVAGRA